MQLSANCTHSYIIPQGVYMYCLLCHTLLPELEYTRKYVETIMPPRIYDITEELWTRIRPWSKLPYQLVTKYAWYISLINSLEYLVMPIFRMGNATFFSARKISETEGLKYTYPLGAKKLPWISSDVFGGTVVITEGVADAAYCSLVSSSVALLGNHYDGSLDNNLRAKRVVVALDGDVVGISSAVGIYNYLAPMCDVEVVTFPDGKEPVDFELPELKEILHV